MKCSSDGHSSGACVGKFTLTEDRGGDSGGLTHLGNPLATLNDLKDDIPPPDDDDSDGDLRQSHRASGARVGDTQRHRTKREVMAEVMAVSKAARAQKRMQNEDDENLLEDVDSRFAGIVEVRSSPVPCSLVLLRVPARLQVTLFGRAA